ncbi:MAG: hypothetical protein K1X75_00070 [Leptospirales bacterium]|nr:hypothetical protein [Leptospirales bacterium]
MEPLQELLEEMESVRAGESWQLELDYALELLGTDRQRYYRFLYSRRHTPGWSEELVDFFGPENVADLVDFAAALGLPGAAAAFQSAGFHFEEERLLEWIEFFQSVSMSRMQSDEIDRDLLETAVAGCQRFSDAAEFYCLSRFDLDEYVRFASGLYLKQLHVQDHHLSRALLHGYLGEQFKRRTMRWEDVCLGLYDRLRQRAEFWEIPIVDADERRLLLLPPELSAALREMEYSGSELPDREDLKQRYRTLLKKYHPDVNAMGKDRCQAIIAAYAHVISVYPDQARR